MLKRMLINYIYQKHTIETKLKIIEYIKNKIYQKNGRCYQECDD